MRDNYYQDLAHEIRKHLTVMKSEAALLLSDQDSELAKMVVENVDEIALLLNDYPKRD